MKFEIPMPSRKRPQAYTAVWEGEGDRRTKRLVFELHDLKNTRDLRSVLLEAAYALRQDPTAARASIALYKALLAKHTIKIEQDQFEAVCAPDLSGRIELTSFAHQHEAHNPKKASQEAVMATLLQRYIHALPGLTVEELAEQCGASVPTIYKAIHRYGHRLAPRTGQEKELQIQTFSRQDWADWIQRNNRLASAYFVDRSGAPRSAMRLAKAMAKLQRPYLAIGGLLGAMHHLPTLDATASPVLEILLHRNPRADLSFIEHIDPALQRVKDAREPAHVVVHFVDRPQSLFVTEDGFTWGALPDCIANMQRARLTHQVDDAIRLIQERAKP